MLILPKFRCLIYFRNASDFGPLYSSIPDFSHVPSCITFNFYSVSDADACNACILHPAWLPAMLLHRHQERYQYQALLKSLEDRDVQLVAG